jgi:hypothetical protein
LSMWVPLVCPSFMQAQPLRAMESNLLSRLRRPCTHTYNIIPEAKHNLYMPMYKSIKLAEYPGNNICVKSSQLTSTS